MARRKLNAALVVLGITAGFIPLGAQQSDSTTASVHTLGGHDWMVPTDLAELVKISQAAVIGRIVRAGELTSLNDIGLKGRIIGVDVFAPYDVAISEVLFNRKSADGPRLAANEITIITQLVGRQEAEAFLARKGPAIVGEEYLMFLWHRPGASSWSVLQWPLQFRRSATVIGGAEAVEPLPGGKTVLKRDWVGPTVPALREVNDTVVPQWSALVEEVKRLSTQTQKPR